LGLIESVELRKSNFTNKKSWKNTFKVAFCVGIDQVVTKKVGIMFVYP
jgi:hypothetical protein